MHIWHMNIFLTIVYKHRKGGCCIHEACEDSMKFTAVIIWAGGAAAAYLKRTYVTFNCEMF